MRSGPLRITVLSALILTGLASTADAAEGGAGVYLLGKRGPLAAFVPKPGWYLTNDVFLLNADRSELTPLGDRIVGNVDAEALINIAQFTGSRTRPSSADAWHSPACCPTATWT